MANSITTAKQFINNQVEHLNIFNRYLLCADLLVKPANISGKVIAYDKMSFASNTMGTYDRGTGLSQKDLTFTRIEKTLTQDRGDTLGLDLMDKDEAQIADGIVGIYNYYQAKVEVPTIDAYAFAQFGIVGGDAQFISFASNAGALNKALAGFKALGQKRVKVEECIFYGSVSFLSALEQDTYGKGLFNIGYWNGNLDAQVRMIKGAKVVEVPDATLGENVDFIICHPLSASVVDVLAGAEYKDNVPGKVAWAQIDVRDHFDAWVEPTGGEGIVVGLSAPRKLVLTETSTHAVAITGVEKGAKVYYKTSAGASSSDTEVTAGADGSHTISAPVSTTTFYVVQYLDGGKSEEVSLKVTI